MFDQNNMPKLIQDLGDRIGRDRILTDSDILDKYSKDETSDLVRVPDMVVRARTPEEVSDILRICNQYRIPVTPRGGGTGVTGGAVPVDGGVVISLELMNRIIEIDSKNMVAVIEPGVITHAIQKAALEHGLMYPPDPASLESCSIGGNVAEGAGGPRAVKYGTTKDYVIGLEFVLPDGSIITTGGKFVKNATGYNLIGILLGSEGTLAVITKIILRLIPAPSSTIDLLIPFQSIDEAVETVCKIIHKKIVPSTIEFMERDSIKLVSKYLNEEMPFPNSNAHLLVQLDGTSEDDIRNDLVRLSLCIDNADDIIVAETKAQRERIWRARRAIREAIHNEDPIFLAEDTVVPISRIPVFLKEVKDYLNSRNLRSVMFGHAGDGNVHIDILKGDMKYEEWKRLLPELKIAIYKRALKNGGTITGEHGIGFLRKNYLPLALSPEEIGLLRRIKAAFDPNMILNPGKLF